MTREEQIKKAAHDFSWGWCDDMAHPLNNGFIKGAEWADQHPQWIHVEERLPKERGQYFVYTAAGQSWQSEWMQDKSGEWCWFCSPMAIGTIANVTHWMPMPQPPRKEAKND